MISRNNITGCYFYFQTKIAAPEFNPKVPGHVKAWVRGESDLRSRMYQLDELEDHLACRGEP